MGLPFLMMGLWYGIAAFGTALTGVTAANVYRNKQLTDRDRNNEANEIIIRKPVKPRRQNKNDISSAVNIAIVTIFALDTFATVMATQGNKNKNSSANAKSNASTTPKYVDAREARKNNLRIILNNYIRDEDSSDQWPDPRNVDYERRVRPASQHIIDRLTRTVRLAGYKQHIAETFSINRLSVINPGRSIYQDQNSNLGPNIHAAHVVRGGTINRVIYDQSPNYYYRILVHFLAHTQNVPAWANYWYGIGGHIDHIQENYQHMLSNIDFSGPINDLEREILQYYVDLHIQALQRAIGSGRLTRDQIEELQDVVDVLKEMSMDALFVHGVEGYEAEIMNNYL